MSGLDDLATLPGSGGIRQVTVRLLDGEGARPYGSIKIDSASKAFELFGDFVAKEVPVGGCAIFALDCGMAPISVCIASCDDLAQRKESVAVAMKWAILQNARGTLLMSNTDAGDPKNNASSPCSQICKMTERMVEAGEVMGVPVADHISIDRETMSYCSFKSGQPHLFDRDQVLMRDRLRVNEDGPWQLEYIAEDTEESCPGQGQARKRKGR